MSILSHFQHISLTTEQKNALEKISAFLQGEDNIFILKGYAGTGKTTLIKGIAQFLKSKENPVSLLAPTGRAAKVLTEKTKIHASTIHRGIYNFDKRETIIEEDSKEEIDYITHFKIADRDISNTVFLIDEASLISNKKSRQEHIIYGSGKLLFDLFKYIRIDSHAANTKIVFVGDPSQLPPVDMNFSPALSIEYLHIEFGYKAQDYTIKEVVRHKKESGILYAAENIRKCHTSGYYNQFNLKANGQDILNPTFESFLDEYFKSKAPKIAIAWKNKTVYELNQKIRERKFKNEYSKFLKKGDHVVFAANNYKLHLLNGEYAVVNQVEDKSIQRSITLKKKGNKKEIVTLVWRKAEFLIPVNNGNTDCIEGYLFENLLYSDSAQLTPDENHALYVDFIIRNKGLKTGTDKFTEALLNDEFYNACKIKFGYAVTCHKAQGGEWPSVHAFWDYGIFDNRSFLQEEQSLSGKINTLFFQWAYTAITRSNDKLFCVNPPFITPFSRMTFIDVQIQKSLFELSNQQIKSVVIDFEGQILDLITKFNLIDAPNSIQDHLISCWYKLKKHNVEITNWEQKAYEIRYYIKRNDETAAIKFWINGKFEFKSKYQKLPSGTNSNSFFEIISALLEEAVQITVNRDEAKKPEIILEFDKELSEEKPFLKTLFESIIRETKKYHINITAISHYQYRERYSFSLDSEKAIFDFEYNKQGFFGRVLPIEKLCNSPKLVELLKEIIYSLKNY